MREKASKESSSSSEPSDHEDFFHDMLRDSSKRIKKSGPQASDVLGDYFDAQTSGSFDGTIPSALKPLFIKLNTPIPSSAAVERLFSKGKDVLRPKRSDLTDTHFKALVCLKSDMPSY